MPTTVIIIPAYQPPSTFATFLRALRLQTDARILVVDDGSGQAFQARFAEATRIDGCILLRLHDNHGKGYALRYAFSFAKQRFSENTVYITADCDGQHTPADILRMQASICACPDALILGCRNFEGCKVPLRSRLGNRISARLFSWMYGTYIKDTQTGLRAFSHTLLSYMLSLRGDRFEYEMRMLTEAHKHHIRVLCTDIETRYDTPASREDVRSHFSPLFDSVKIMLVLGASGLRYTLCATVCAIFDAVLFFLLERFVFGGREEALFVLVSVVLSRVLSSVLNFLLNIFFVFRQRHAYSLAKYYVVWAARLAASYALTLMVRPLAATVLGLTLMKGGIDLLLGMVTFRLLRTWVFVTSSSEVG